jgi:hypothetical protein
MNTPMAENAAAAKSFAAKERAMEFALGVPTPDTGGPSRSPLLRLRRVFEHPDHNEEGSLSSTTFVNDRAKASGDARERFLKTARWPRPAPIPQERRR